jgi:hypothetical protein
MQNSRKLAIEHMEHQYFTGLPCKHGHIAKRETITGACCDCRRLIVQQQNEKKKQLRQKFKEIR